MPRPRAGAPRPRRAALPRAETTAPRGSTEARRRLRRGGHRPAGEQAARRRGDRLGRRLGPFGRLLRCLCSAARGEDERHDEERQARTRHPAHCSEQPHHRTRDDAGGESCDHGLDATQVRGRLPGLAGRSPHAAAPGARVLPRSEVGARLPPRGRHLGSRRPARGRRAARAHAQGLRARRRPGQAGSQRLGPWEEGDRPHRPLRLRTHRAGRAGGPSGGAGRDDRLDDEARVAPPPERVALPGRPLGAPRPREPAVSERQAGAVRRHQAAGHPRHPLHDAFRSRLACRQRPRDLPARRLTARPGARSPASSTSGPGSTIRSRSAAGFERCPSSRPRITRAASRLKVVRLDDGKVIVDRDVFVNDVTLGAEARALGRTPIPFSNHYAPGTKQNLRANTALPRGLPRAGTALVPPVRPPAQHVLGYDEGQERPVPAHGPRLGSRRQPRRRVARRNRPELLTRRVSSRSGSRAPGARSCRPRPRRSAAAT